MKLIGRQGDVFIYREEKHERKIPVVENAVIALGESTGHKHVLTKSGEDSVIRWLQEQERQLVSIEKGSGVLVHEEHKKHTLPMGDYVFGIQQEFDPIERRRRVQD